MSHNAVTDRWKTIRESTKRALRTGLQGLTATALAVTVLAIPPVESAVNAWLTQINPGMSLPAGLVAAIGVVGAATVALVSKLQNLIEGRDKPTTVVDWAAYAELLSEQVTTLRAALDEARSAASGK